jgi:hypothetical protein
MIKKSVGRPKLKNKKTTLAIRVTQEVRDWISEQEDSAGVVIEKLVMDKINKNR